MHGELTRDQIKHCGEMLAAYACGKNLVYSDGTKVTGRFFGESNLDFLLNCTIAPEPRWRPWTEAEIEAECIKGTVLKSTGPHKNVGPMSYSGGELFVGPTGKCHMNRGQFLLENYVIAATGEPCGVLE